MSLAMPMKKALILGLFSCFLISCNNSSVPRLSATYLCKSDDVVGGYDFNPDERPSDFTLQPSFDLTQNLRTREVYFTLNINDDNGKVVTISYANQNVQNLPANLSEVCGAGFYPEAEIASPVIFYYPIGIHSDGFLNFTKSEISFGQPQKEDLTDLLKKPKNTYFNTADQTEISPAPLNYNDLLSGLNMQVYKKNDEPNSRDQYYYIHFRDSAIGLQGRLVVEVF